MFRFFQNFPFDGFDKAFTRFDESGRLIELDLPVNQFLYQQKSFLTKNDASNGNGRQGAMGDGIHSEIIRSDGPARGAEVDKCYDEDSFF